ncbi:hypothetical protein E2C01_065674 [Portunus trituberculatus]|uniref:Uncharacterized protein n=1 Tax=Portunus trituberculatus TaxID=210409 RepID=A0A5B7HQ85_PORTR|nr:hypothetical protein [Portunus trituberculatus]
MGVECKTDNNNVITTTCGSMRTQLASASAQSSPPARHRKARMAACLSSVSAGEDRATVRSSLAARDSLGTRGVGPDAGIEVEKAERRISAGGFNRHKLLSGDTRLLAARSPPSPAATPTKRVSREKTGSSVSTQPPPSGKSPVKRRPTIDFTKSASGCQNKTSTKSGVPVRKSNSTAEKRKSLPPGAVRASEAPSVTLRPTASQNRLRPKSLGSESLVAAVTSHARREAAATVKPLTQTVTRGAPRPSTTMRTSISTRLSEKWTPGGGDASKITSVSIATSLSASLASTTDMPPPSATADSVQHAGG